MAENESALLKNFITDSEYETFIALSVIKEDELISLLSDASNGIFNVEVISGIAHLLKITHIYEFNNLQILLWESLPEKLMNSNIVKSGSSNNKRFQPGKVNSFLLSESFSGNDRAINKLLQYEGIKMGNSEDSES